MTIKSLTVSPPSISLNLTPGATYAGELIIQNPSSATEDMIFSAKTTPYSIIGTDYSADFSSSTIYTDLANWITLSEETGTIAPGEQHTLTYTITVPTSAPAGGQYAAIAVANLADSSETINESFEIASIIFARVAGEISEAGKIISTSSPAIVFTPPVTTTMTLENSGNIHLNAEVKTTITSVFSGTSILASDRQTQTETIMPGTTRSATYVFDEFPELGLFNYSQTITYAGEVKTDSHLIFVCPIWFMILIIITIITTVSTIISKIIKHNRKKSYNS